MSKHENKLERMVNKVKEKIHPHHDEPKDQVKFKETAFKEPKVGEVKPTFTPTSPKDPKAAHASAGQANQGIYGSSHEQLINKLETSPPPMPPRQQERPSEKQVSFDTSEQTRITSPVTSSTSTSQLPHNDAISVASQSRVDQLQQHKDLATDNTNQLHKDKEHVQMSKVIHDIPQVKHHYPVNDLPAETKEKHQMDTVVEEIEDIGHQQHQGLSNLSTSTQSGSAPQRDLLPVDTPYEHLQETSVNKEHEQMDQVIKDIPFTEHHYPVNDLPPETQEKHQMDIVVEEIEEQQHHTPLPQHNEQLDKVVDEINHLDTKDSRYSTAKDQELQGLEHPLHTLDNSKDSTPIENNQSPLTKMPPVDLESPLDTSSTTAQHPQSVSQAIGRDFLQSSAVDHEDKDNKSAENASFMSTDYTANKEQPKDSDYKESLMQGVHQVEEAVSSTVTNTWNYLTGKSEETTQNTNAEQARDSTPLTHLATEPVKDVIDNNQTSIDLKSPSNDSFSSTTAQHPQSVNVGPGSYYSGDHLDKTGTEQREVIPGDAFHGLGGLPRVQNIKMQQQSGYDK